MTGPAEQLNVSETPGPEQDHISEYVQPGSLS
jgi:hypothetical protein